MPSSDLFTEPQNDAEKVPILNIPPDYVINVLMYLLVLDFLLEQVDKKDVLFCIANILGNYQHFCPWAFECVLLGIWLLYYWGYLP